MKTQQKKRIILLALLLIAALAAMYCANIIQTDGGNIALSRGYLESEAGPLFYKLYTPKTATSDAPAPAVLLLHGYQNDHETCAGYAIELAKHGYVVLCIDEFGHGKAVPGLEERGYVNKKVSVNFGEESTEDGTFKEIGGTVRYRLLMNFSNLSFFNDIYTKDDAGNSIKNSAEGGIEAYKWLAALPNVDPMRMGVSGHSMGTWASWSVAAALWGAKDSQGRDITPKATVLQCGELFRKSAYDSENIRFNNVLLLQAKYDEFSYFRDYKNTVSDELLKTDLRTEFLGTTGDKAAWNTTFGSFSDGSARRMELLYTNHRLTTHNAKGLKTAVEWFDQALDHQSSLSASSLSAMPKEWLNLSALLLCLAAALVFMDILLETGFFRTVRQELPSHTHMLKGGKWWGSAIASMLISGLLYPFATQLGHALVPLPEHLFRMTVGNGLITWYCFVILINLCILFVQRRKAKKKGQADSWYERGLSSREKPRRIDWSLAFRGCLLAFSMAALIYICVTVFDALFMLDLRMIWPMLGTFNAMRFGQFCLYFIFFAAFFTLVQSKAMAGLRTEGLYGSGIGSFIRGWLPSALAMSGGIILIVLIEYIPFFANIGPGADLLFGSTFGGPFMSLMILLLPQIIVYSFLGYYCYKRTGNVYTGSIFSGILACWIVTSGSSFL